MRSITTVKVDSGHFPFDAHGEVTAPALLAHEAMAAMPTDTDTLTFLPGGYVAGQSIDAPGNFVARHAGKLKPGPDAVFDQSVAVANAAGLDLDAYLAATRLGNVALDEFPITTCFADLRCLHFRAHYCS
jgi:hypothetical protein